MQIKKLKKKDYVETLELIKEIAQEGFIQKNINAFLAGDVELSDSIINLGISLAEVLGKENISNKLDNLLLKTIEGLDLNELDLDEYIELVINWVEVQGLMGLLKKAFPPLDLEKIME